METTGWSNELPRIPGYYWVRLPGYERAPTIAEIELHDGVLEILHEGLDGPRGWVPLEQKCGPEHEAEWWDRRCRHRSEYGLRFRVSQLTRRVTVLNVV